MQVTKFAFLTKGSKGYIYALQSDQMQWSRTCYSGNMITLVGTIRKDHTPALSAPPPQPFNFKDFFLFIEDLLIIIKCYFIIL